MTVPPPQAEKPFHYTYLKEFRVNQCPLFLQHKCTQHRPFTCFYWHFSNQRRRRPLRKRDGTFNYSADVYCSKYDETTGVCPDKDDCPFVHRNTGDTERRYHLRYYKTGTCIHETDTRGNCVKNGPHCAFAHGSHDLRPPVYDIKEQQRQQISSTSASTSSEQIKQETVNLAEKIVNEDPKWQEANYVLANYKTELCKRPPRLCRQGYACPQYHNTKDRRRNPMKFKYRSSPCPAVKHGDDWRDPSSCEKGDSCQFCHTRTEQQFHPEIYKSTKCHDMTQTGYCPRGPFCAFAHVEQEIRVLDDVPNLAVETFNKPSIGDLSITSAAEIVEQKSTVGSMTNAPEVNYTEVGTSQSSSNVWTNFTKNLSQNSVDINQSFSKSFSSDNGISRPMCPSPISKPVAGSLGSSKDFPLGAAYCKAPGSQRSSFNDQLSLNNNSGFGNLGSTSAWPSMPMTHSANVNTVGSFSNTIALPKQLNALNSDAAPFYPPDETVDSVVDSALKDHDDPKLGEANEEKSISSQIWSQHITSGHESGMPSFFPMSDPVNVPRERTLQDNIQSGLHSGLQSMSPSLGSVDFPSAGRYLPMPQSSLVGSVGQASIGSSGGSGIKSNLELDRMQQKCKQWEDSWNQAKAACDAWKREATDANERARLAEDRGRLAVERCRFLGNKLNINASGNGDKKCPFLHQHYKSEDLRKMPVASLKQLQNNYKADLELVEKLIWEMLWKPQQKN